MARSLLRKPLKNCKFGLAQMAQTKPSIDNRIGFSYAVSFLGGHNESAEMMGGPELSGRIAAVGEGVKNRKVGERIGKE